MSAPLSIDTSLDQDPTFQDLLRQQAEIQVQINAQLQARIAASSSSASATSFQRSPINKNYGQRQSNNVARSMSSTGATMARQQSDRIEAPIRCQRTLSQQSAPAPSMARTNSKGASSTRSGNIPFTQTGNIPFTQNGANMPPPFRSERENLPMDAWMKDQSLSAFTLHQPHLQRSTSQQSYGLEQVPEQDLSVGENPLDFISRTMGTPTLAISPPFSTPSSATLSHNHFTSGSYNINSPSTPTTESLTTGTTLPSNMSRQNSLCNEFESIQMMKYNTNSSFPSDVNSSDQFMYNEVDPSFVSQHRRSSSEEQSQLLVGAGGVGNDSQLPLSFSSEDPFSPSICGAKMEKSQSSESNSSSTSSNTRNKQRLLATLAFKPLQPKGDTDIPMSRSNSSKSMSKTALKDGSQDKVAISNRPGYQRPKHGRVYCTQCESQTDGFRGEHELRRHQDREHKPSVKKWMCIEPTGSGHPKTELLLTKCKACIQKKKYGAYYNAAAHLRRAHFKPKKGRSKSTKVDDAEKRGGKGGGDWPPMSELKHYWMTEVEEAQEYPMSTSSLQEDEDDAVDAEMSDGENVEGYEQTNYSPQTMLSNNFDNSFINNTSPILNNTSPLNNFNVVGNEMLDLSTFASLNGVESGCGDDFSGQNQFPNFANSLAGFVGNELFETNSGVAGVGMNQGFDEQILRGPDFNFSSTY